MAGSLELEPLERKSLAASVFEQLRDRIVHGAFSPGQALPAERVLAEALGVNRGAVREGLRRLEQAGLVSVQQGGATRVLDFKRTGGLQLLGALIVRPDGSIDTAVARSVLDLRTVLGRELARCAAERATDAEVDALSAVIERMREAGSDLPALQELAMAFWDIAVTASGNMALRLAFNSMARSYADVRAPLAQVLQGELTALDAYARVRDAIDDGDPDAAAERTEILVERGAAAIRAVLDKLDADARASARPAARRRRVRKGAKR